VSPHAFINANALDLFLEMNLVNLAGIDGLVADNGPAASLLGDDVDAEDFRRKALIFLLVDPF
jgi:hypothetical protein